MNKKVVGLGALIIVVLLILVGCARDEPLDSPPRVTEGEESVHSTIEILDNYVIDGKYITVFYDEKRDVTCWMMAGISKGGISCFKGKR